MTDFATLLYTNLPGIYRQKDESGQLAAFLQIMASPFTELEQSVAQLNEDFFLETCRDELVSFTGGLIGVEVDPTLPAGVQRTEIEQAFAFYRSKGLAVPIRTVVQALTGWETTTVDFSLTVSLVPFIETMNPVLRQRRRPVGESPVGSGRFYFSPALSVLPLYDARLGRPITRDDVATRPAELLGVEAGFGIRERGVELFTQAVVPYVAVAADLTDFANPKTPGGLALAVIAGQIAVDPQLGRFLIVSPLPLAGDLTVDYSQLVPASIPAQTVDITDSSQMLRFGRSDDLTPRTLDLRGSRDIRDGIGRYHFDNHGLFLTLGQMVGGQPPNRLGVATPAWFTFDSRPLAPLDLAGNALMLLDGLDGTPLTRDKLNADPASFLGAPRGFDIQIRGVSLADPAFAPAVTLVAANLTDFTHPTHPDGSALTVGPTTVAVDPELGRFMLDLVGLGAAAEQVRVGYLLGPAIRAAGTAPLLLAAAAPGVWAFAKDGALTALRDAYDGTPISIKLNLGGALASFHGTDRGYRLYVNGADVTATLTAQIAALDDTTLVAPAGKLLIDLDRGRFSVPAGFVPTGAALTVDFSFEDLAAEGRVVESLSQHLPRMMPAGVVPVIIDTRQVRVDPAVLQ